MVNRQLLTDVAIRKLEAPASGQLEVWDSRLPGFGIRISPKGTRSFVLLYRYNGRSRRLTLGRYPILSLADARAKAQLALADVARATIYRMVEREEFPRQLQVAPRRVGWLESTITNWILDYKAS